MTWFEISLSHLPWLRYGNLKRLWSFGASSQNHPQLCKWNMTQDCKGHYIYILVYTYILGSDILVPIFHWNTSGRKGRGFTSCYVMNPSRKILTGFECSEHWCCVWWRCDQRSPRNLPEGCGCWMAWFLVQAVHVQDSSVRKWLKHLWEKIQKRHWCARGFACFMITCHLTSWRHVLLQQKICFARLWLA